VTSFAALYPSYERRSILRNSPRRVLPQISQAVEAAPVKPFALTSASQFRPAPAIALESAEWAADYNEIKELGGRASTKRSARQTEDARFWLVTDGRGYYPVIRTLVEAKKLSLVDSARLFALAAVAREDALIAVFDAKYHYEFWRPATAIPQRRYRQQFGHRTRCCLGTD
jgi:hypothetical protein